MMVDALKRRGLVARQAHPEDRRVKQLRPEVDFVHSRNPMAGCWMFTDVRCPASRNRTSRRRPGHSGVVPSGEVVGDGLAVRVDEVCSALPQDIRRYCPSL